MEVVDNSIAVGFATPLPVASSKVWRAPGSKMATFAEKLAPDTKPAPPTSPAATLVIMFP